MDALGKITLLIVPAIIGAWAFSTLWGWFIVPLGFPALSWAHAYGVMLVVGILKPKNKDFKSTVGEKRDFSDFVLEFINYLLIYTVAVGMGWVVMLFM